MALAGKVSAVLNLVETLTGDLENARAAIDQNLGWTIADGTGVNQANLVWSDTRTLGSGANEDLDVSGALAGLTGAKVFVKVKSILVMAAAANTVSVTVSRPAANGLPFFSAASDAVVLPPGGIFLLVNPSAAGIAVTAGTGDLINILAGAASSVYSIVIIGTNA